MKKTFTEGELKKMDEIFKATSGQKIVVAERKSDEDNFYGLGFNMCERDGRFWLTYSSAYHGGGTITHEITEYEYTGVRNGTIPFATLQESYPERDGYKDENFKP